jgi:hypothetical protein
MRTFWEVSTNPVWNMTRSTSSYFLLPKIFDVICITFNTISPEPPHTHTHTQTPHRSLLIIWCTHHFINFIIIVIVIIISLMIELIAFLKLVFIMSVVRKRMTSIMREYNPRVKLGMKVREWENESGRVRMNESVREWKWENERVRERNRV